MIGGYTKWGVELASRWRQDDVRMTGPSWQEQCGAAAPEISIGAIISKGGPNHV